MKSRILLLFSCFLGLWGVLAARAMFIQIFPDVRLENLKRKQFETSLQIRTRRGAILDRHGAELAASVPAYSLFADPKMIRDHYRVAQRLAKQLRMSPQKIRQLFKNKEKRFVWVKRQMSEKERDIIRRWDEPGLGFIEEPKRVYPNGALLSHTLGFVGSEGRGLEGLELKFNEHLEGKIKQVLLPRDARGRPLLRDGRSLTEVPDGADLQLTIDREVQFMLERELQFVTKEFNANSAQGVIMDAQTSEILALAFAPTVDLNEGWRVKPERRRNRLVTDAFEPGSTLKTFVVAAALREGTIKPNTRFDCEGGRLKVADRWITEAESSHAFGLLSVSEILAYSSNIGVAKIAFEMGADKLSKALADFGFGSRLNIDLPGEARGIVNPLPWRSHLLSNISFGHGIAVTPIQLAAAYTAIANGGVLKQPFLVKSIRELSSGEVQQFTSQEIRRVLTTQQAATLRLMLTAATQDKGTGARARIPGYPVAGKTGTAQKVDPVKGGYIPKAYISSFAGFVPANNPRYVIYVAVDNPTKSYYGSEVAAPVFARLAQSLVRQAGLPPVLISERNVISPAPEPKKQDPLPVETILDEEHFPNLLGLTLREALSRMKLQVGQIDVRGHGMVVRTVPRAGEPFSKKKKVTLVLQNPD